MIVFIGADHKGFELKEKLKVWLSQNGHQVEDMGATNLDPSDDYPKFAEAVAQHVSLSTSQTDYRTTGQESTARRGIVLCGSGVGVDIVANKFDGVRSGLGINADQIASARRDDDINVLALAASEIDESQAIEIIKKFLETDFEDADRRTRRLEEIKNIEQNN